jgi:hypothetical protein
VEVGGDGKWLAYALRIYLNWMEKGGDFSVAIMEEVVGEITKITSEWLDALFRFRSLGNSLGADRP